MGENTALPPVEDLAEDPEARFEYLVAAGVFEVDDEDQVTTTAAFEDTRGIYAETYEDVSREEMVETVADLFDVAPDEARSRLESEELTRHEVITYLSLQSFLEQDLTQGTLALLTSMAAEVGFGSAVPDYMRELTDETYQEFLDEAGDAFVLVCKYPCDPCRRMKAELPDLLDTLPDSIAVAGVDGEAELDFRAAFEVESAPTVLLFADGEVAASHEGYTSVDDLAVSVGEVYDAVEVEFVDEA